MNARDVRKTFLDFFVEKGHQALPSSPVIPHGDKTLLFTNAGMNQFKDIFTGNVKPENKRATTVQKCIRAGGKHNDLDNVGYTSRHLTFFEMLGNFSFGDYFKEEAIGFAWELITERFKMTPDRLWVTVFHEDDEARALWRKISGLPDDRIVGLGEKDNYWSMGDVGPCGPCSEILVDRGPAFGDADIENGERFFEIWNLVFMQFDQNPGGKKEPLPRPSIDTGMGLERLLMVMQGVDNIFDTDILRGLISRVEELTSVPYDPGSKGVPHRVIADHIRSLAFAFADGAEPSNEGRGYVLRRILRRAARYGRKISQEDALLCRLVDDVVSEMGDAFPELKKARDFVESVIRNEEHRFGETLDNGLQLFEETAQRLRAGGKNVIPGADVFKLYDTFGFPVDLVEQMAGETGFDVDTAGFEERMAQQKERSRGASQFQVGAETGDALDLEGLPESTFLGYEESRADVKIQRAVAVDGNWHVVLERTPFYAESGGQVGDCGRLRGDGFELEVIDTKKDRGRFVHICRLLEGDEKAVRVASGVEATVDVKRRQAIARNHTATHLLHAALRQVLGHHVRQKGSLVDPSRLRFDVTHFSGVAPAELAEVEEIVRQQILEDTPVEISETPYDDAVAKGAMALFGEKYGDVVRVVRVGDFSTELCGGIHVERTGQIGPFLVASEGSVSSGVRRLEALTAAAADGVHRQKATVLATLAKLLKTNPDSVVERVEKLLLDNRELKTQSKASGATGAEASGDVKRQKIGEMTFISVVLKEADGKALREAYDRVKQETERLVTVVVSEDGDSLRLLVGVSRALVDEGVAAPVLFKAASARIEGRGGGRPEMAQGGGKNLPGGTEKALAAIREILEKGVG